MAVFKLSETCVQNNGLQWQAETLGSQIIQLNAGVQQRLTELTNTVKSLTVNAYPAPGLNFPMIEDINAYQKSWGQAELATLRSTPQGKAVLSQPLTNANILAAKTSIRYTKETSSSQQATAGASQVTINLHSAVEGGIGSLRPENCVLSKKMAKNSHSVDMAKAIAHSGKSYTQLTNPWWAAREA